MGCVQSAHGTPPPPHTHRFSIASLPVRLLESIMMHRLTLSHLSSGGRFSARELSSKLSHSTLFVFPVVASPHPRAPFPLSLKRLHLALSSPLLPSLSSPSTRPHITDLPLFVPRLRLTWRDLCPQTFMRHCGGSRILPGAAFHLPAPVCNVKHTTLYRGGKASQLN